MTISTWDGSPLDSSVVPSTTLTTVHMLSVVLLELFTTLLTVTGKPLDMVVESGVGFLVLLVGDCLSLHLVLPMVLTVSDSTCMYHTDTLCILTHNLLQILYLIYS